MLDGVKEKKSLDPVKQNFPHLSRSISLLNNNSKKNWPATKIFLSQFRYFAGNDE